MMRPRIVVLFSSPLAIDRGGYNPLMARSQKVGLLLLGIGLCLVLLLVLRNPWGSSGAGSGAPASSDAPTPASSDAAVHDSVATVRLASRKGDDTGGLLGASMPTPDSPRLLPPGSQASLASDVVDWMTAYGDLDPNRWVAMMSNNEVALPTQLSDPKVLKEYWLSSLEAVRHIRFDPSKTTTNVIPLSSLQDLRKEDRANCATRTGARPFMQAALDAGQLGVEVTFAGNYVTAKSSGPHSVALAVVLAWNKNVSKWTVVRVCVVNVPEGLNDETPLL